MVDILILPWLIYAIVAGIYGQDFSTIPLWVVFALDHAIFVG